jgi:HEPN domain-containing protein
VNSAAEKGMEFLKKKSEGFYRVADSLFNEKDFGLSAFNIEQAVHLGLKYFIGTRLGEFEKTHELRTLFRDSIKLCPELQTLYDSNIGLIGDIESAYIMARYFDTKYEESEVRKMLDFYEELTTALAKCEER